MSKSAISILNLTSQQQPQNHKIGCDAHFFPASLAHSLSHPAILSFTSLRLELLERPAYNHSLDGPSKGQAVSKVVSVAEDAAIDEVLNSE